jgi:hypothetical protein
MKNVPFEGSREIGKPTTMMKDDCVPAHAMPFVQQVDVQPLDTEADAPTKKQPVQCWLLCYVPSPEDLAAMNAGEPVWLKIMANGLPPHALFTMNPQTGHANLDNR